MQGSMLLSLETFFFGAFFSDSVFPAGQKEQTRTICLSVRLSCIMKAHGA